MLKYQRVLVEQGHVKHILAVFGDYILCMSRVFAFTGIFSVDIQHVKTGWLCRTL